MKFLRLIHDMLSEFSRRNLLRKHNVEFLKRAILGLRETEPRPNRREETKSSPEEGSFASPVPRSRVHHVRLEDAANDVADIVGAPAQHDSLGADLCGADFRDDGIDDGADSHGVGAEPDEAEDSLNVFDGCGLVDAGKNGDEVEGCDEDVEADKEDGAAAEAGDEEPGDDRAAEGDTCAAEADAVGSVGIDTCLFEETI